MNNLILNGFIMFFKVSICSIIKRKILLMIEKKTSYLSHFAIIPKNLLRAVYESIT